MECGEWERARREALDRLEEHSRRGLVDYDIEGFLHEFNRKGDCVFTTSSCSGRVVVITGRDVFDKRGSSIIASSHDPIECREIVGGARDPSASGGLTWVSLQPPILHVAARSQEVAERIVSCAVQAGFARAGYKRMRPCGYHVEVAAYDKVHVFLPAPQHVLESLCTILSRYKEKLERLESCLLQLRC